MKTLSHIITFFGLFFLIEGPSFAQTAKPDTGLVHQKTITGAIRPKSVGHNQQGLFFAQNMMYRHSITVYDRTFTLKKTISDEITLRAYGQKGYKGKHKGAPVEVAFSPDGRYAWVSNYQMYGKGFDKPGSDQCARSSTYDKSFIYKIDTETLEIVRILKAGCVPKHLACSPDGQLLLVSNWCSGDLSIFDAEADTLVRQIALGNYPRGVAIDSKSTFAYVTVMGAYKIARINLRDFSVRFEKVGRTPRHICLSPDDRYLYVSMNAEGKVKKYDLSTFNLLETCQPGTTPRSMVLSPDGQFLYVVNYKDNRMSKIKTADMSVVQRVKTNQKPIGITMDADNQTIWVACYSGSIMVFKDVSMNIQPLIAEEAPLTLQHAYFSFFTPQDIFRLPDNVHVPDAKKEEFAYDPPSPTLPKTTPKQLTYCIILGSFQQKANAQKAQEQLAAKNLKTRILTSERGNRLAYGHFADRKAAELALAQMEQKGWILKQE